MSTTLPHGIIQINEGNISWYGDITANWQLIDSKIGEYDAAVASIPAPANNGTLTINYAGAIIAMFGADDAGNVSADIPAPGDGALTVTQGGSTLGSFTANQATPETIDIPAPGDGTLTIRLNGTDVQTFTANQAGNATVDIPVPTRTSQLTNDSGYLTSSSNLDASKLTSGTVDIERLPQGALERLVKVANEAARYALTTSDVQLGDTVQQLDTGIMYVVTDIDHLDSAAGYTEYTAGTAASVPWSGVTGKPTFAAVATSGAYSDLTGTPTIPTVNNATLTIQQNGVNVQTFTANASTNKTANIQCVDLSSNQTVGGNKEFTGTTTAHDLVPSATDTYNFGSSSYQWNNAYIKSLTINGVACGDILTHNASEFVGVTGEQRIGGIKTFTGLCIFSPYRVQIKNSSQEIGVVPSSNQWNGISFTDKNNRNTFSIEQAFMTNGNTILHFSMMPNIADGSLLRIFESTYNASTAEIVTKSRTLIPDANNSRDLGTSTNKWKSIYSNTYYLGNTAFGNIVTHNASEFVLVSDLATVATSGSYNDLSNRPTIPTVNNATLTIQRNGTTVKTFTANASSNVTANITVPTKTSELTNDSGFLTSADLLPTGSYIQFAGSQAPAGFLVCNGGEISRTTYSALFAVIGTTYGSGDGSTTFNLPDLTDRFLQGNTTVGAVRNAGLPNVKGNIGAFATIAGVNVISGAFGSASEPGAAIQATASSGTGCLSTGLDASRSNSIYGNSTTVQPPALTCLICIKY